MNILVTGGAGFIGRWVVKQLISEDVLVFDDLSRGSLDNLKEFGDYHRIKICKGDIRNKNLLEKLFKKNSFDICIHLAALVSVQHSIENPYEVYEVNSTGTMNLLEECRRRDVRLVYLSTCMVYDSARNEKSINEAHLTKPRSPYAASKLAAEELVLGYHGAYGLSSIILRPFNVYGSFQRSYAEGGVISVFLRRALGGKPLEIFGSGRQTRDFMYAEDCADFIVMAARSQISGEIINGGSGKDISITQLANLIAGDPSRVTHQPHPHPQSEIMKLVCDYAKATKLLGWKPKTPLSEGIEKTKRWIDGKL